MAEFIDTTNQIAQRTDDEAMSDGMNAFGKPVSFQRRSVAMDHCKSMGLDDTGKSMAMIDRASEAIRRDKPYEALEALTCYLDLTGAYRLLAVLCTA